MSTSRITPDSRSWIATCAVKCASWERTCAPPSISPRRSPKSLTILSNQPRTYLVSARAVYLLARGQECPRHTFLGHRFLHHTFLITALATAADLLCAQVRRSGGRNGLGPA